MSRRSRSTIKSDEVSVFVQQCGNSDFSDEDFEDDENIYAFDEEANDFDDVEYFNGDEDEDEEEEEEEDSSKLKKKLMKRRSPKKKSAKRGSFRRRRRTSTSPSPAEEQQPQQQQQQHQDLLKRTRSLGFISFKRTPKAPQRIESSDERRSLNRKAANMLGVDMEGKVIKSGRKFSLHRRSLSSNLF